MPVKVPATLPAKTTLERENIFIIDEDRALRQNIKPLRIVILNLMPTKIVTETQLLRLLSNSALQIEITLLYTATHVSKNTDTDHLLNHYLVFDEIKQENFDGLIVTGAPVEQLPFEKVDYWNELVQILDWAQNNVQSNLYICWGAQAALYHKYRIPKHDLPKKMFGIYNHQTLFPTETLLRGFDEVFSAPHSRYTEVRRSDVEKISELKLLAESEVAGVYLVGSNDGRHIFVTGHPEYDLMTLKTEYDRDINAGLSMQIPQNYFPNNDPTKTPNASWRAHASLLYSNWLNYHVYQATAFDSP